MKKRGQVAIFVIIAILIVVLVALFFLFRKGAGPGFTQSSGENPQAFLKTCAEDSIKEAVQLISSQGGYIEPELKKTFKFTDEDRAYDIAYLCYNQNYYYPCINQEPLLIKHIEAEIKNYIGEDVEDCFVSLGQSLTDDGYVVDSNYNGFEVELIPGKISISIDAEMKITKSGETQKIENINVFLPDKIYDLIIVVNEAVGKEAETCSFEYLDYMLFYPEIKIEEYTTQDGSKIYTLTHKETNEWFRFGVRGCVMPPGI